MICNNNINKKNGYVNVVHIDGRNKKPNDETHGNVTDLYYNVLVRPHLLFV